MQEPEEENVPEGQVDTHFPLEARRFEVQVRQKSAEPAQVPHEDEHAILATKFSVKVMRKEATTDGYR